MKANRDGSRSRLLRGSIIASCVLTAAAIYYVYTTFIGRPPAEVYVAQRGMAISAVYGTVSIVSNMTEVLYAQNSGYLHLAPGFFSKVTSLGVIVTKNQPLGTIVDEAGTRALTQARTDFEAAKARLKLGPGEIGVLESAQARLKALRSLSNPQSVPAVERTAAENEVVRIQGIVENEKLELQRQVDQTANVVKTYEDQLKRTEIRSPMDGVVVGSNYDDGSFVLINNALFTIATAENYVSGQVNEEDVGKLKEGMKAELRLYAYGDTTFTATLSAILPSPDPNSQRYTVTLALDNPPANLRAGLTGEMNIILGKKEHALTIPARALLIDQVLVVDDDVVRQRTVKVGFKSLESAEILDGVSEGEQVIVSDQDTFHLGERVRPVKINAQRK